MKNTDTFVRSTKHHFTTANTTKLQNYSILYAELHKCLVWYVDYIWNAKLFWTSNSKVKTFDIKNKQFDCPKFISTVDINCHSPLSARMQKHLSTQACGIIASAIQCHIKTNKPLIKPTLKDDMGFEVGSLCIDMQSSSTFDFWLRLKCLGKSFKSFKLPLKHHKRSLHHAQYGIKLNSFLLKKDHIQLRWRYAAPKNSSKVIVGADQGLNSTLTLSDDSQTALQHSNGWTLNGITELLTRKKKGSKAFKRAQDLRLNYTNWYVNRLNIGQYKEVRLEDIKNLRLGKSTSRKLSHWSYPLIKRKMQSVCEEAGVQLKLIPSFYRSQRCSTCGLVKKSNRQGEIYSCLCGNVLNADLNAAKNLLEDLVYLPKDFVTGKNNISGFYWLTDRYFPIGSLQSPIPQKDLI